MKPAQFIVTGKARLFACGLALVLALGAAAPAPPAVAAAFAKGAHLVVTKDATWHYDPGQAAGFTVPAGDDVYVLDGPTDGEYFVAWGSDKGWLDASDLAPAGATNGSGNSTASANSTAGTSGTPSASADSSASGSAASGSGAGLTEDELSGPNVEVAHSSNGVNLRAKPSHDAAIVDKLSEGIVLQLRISDTNTVYDPDGTTRWWPVRYNGEDGWIAGFYLAPTSGTTAGTASNAAAASDNGQSANAAAAASAAPGLSEDQLTGSSVRVANSGNGVNLRAKPSAGASVVDKLSEDTVVQLRIDSTDTVVADGVRWWPVRYNGEDGWIAGQYLAPTTTPASATASSSSSSSSGNTGNATPSGTAKFAAGDYAAAKTRSGSGVNIRAGAAPNADKVGFISEGDVVQVMAGPVVDSAGDAWYKVTNGDVTGYADGDLLVPASQPAPPKSEQTPAPAPVKFATGDYAAAKTPGGVGVNIRSDAAMGAGRVGFINENGIVQIEGGPTYDSAGNAWYQVSSNGVTGYADGDLLAASSGPASSASAPPASTTAAASSSASGFIYPLGNFTLTQGYGCTPLSIEPYDAVLGCNFHNAVDLAAPSYTPIMAAAAGTVVYAGWCDCGLGYMVEIDHGNGFHTVYGHMAEQPYVSVGQSVSQGETIGPVGTTGNSTGPHVHFEIVLNGNTVDPLSYLP